MNVAATTAMRSPRSVCVGSSTGAGYARASQHGRTQVVCVLFLASSRLADRCTGSRSGISAAFITSEPELQRWPFNEVVSAGRPIWRQQPDEPYGVIEVDPPLQYEDDQEQWDDTDDETLTLPGRPRRQLFNRGSAALLALITCAIGFYVGIRVEKGQVSSSGGTARAFTPPALGGTSASSSTSRK